MTELRYPWRVGTTTIELSSRRPLVMGIVNVTPDSFSDGGRFLDPERAIEQACRLLDEGADIVDIGGESTRPGALPVPANEELRRVLPVIEAVRHARPGALISIDTYKGRVARAAVEAGAQIVNDVRGGADPELLRCVAESGAGLVLMHMRGTPTVMQRLASYGDVVCEVADELRAKIRTAQVAGVHFEQIVVDPGVGFAKKRRHNWELLRRLNELHRLERPVLLGISRKGFLGDVTGRLARDRDLATMVALAGCYYRGFHIARVHHAGYARDTFRVLEVLEFGDGAGR